MRDGIKDALRQIQLHDTKYGVDTVYYLRSDVLPSRIEITTRGKTFVKHTRIGICRLRSRLLSSLGSRSAIGRTAAPSKGIERSVRQAISEMRGRTGERRAIRGNISQNDVAAHVRAGEKQHIGTDALHFRIHV